MKTADLIPFILLELAEGDKYGFELTKNIETKSNGQIIIKQPTLYTLLKKLEKSNFISSYWEDSEIGGKRHYYKLTQNGRLQISTFPSYDVLLKKPTDEDSSLDLPNQPKHSTRGDVQQEKSLSIMDELLHQSITQNESILPSSEVFADSNIDSATELEINLTNAEILKDDLTSKNEKFAENKQVATFTERLPVVSAPTATITNDTKSNDVLNGNFIPATTQTEIKFVDYVDFKNSKEYKYSKKVVCKKLLQALSTSITLLCLIVFLEIITFFTGHSPLYFTFLIAAILITLFHPVAYIVKKEKYRLYYQKHKYIPKIKNRVFVGLSICLFTLIIGIVVSINSGNNTIGKLLSFKNFANLYAPLLFSLIYLIDTFYNYLISQKLDK